MLIPDDDADARAREAQDQETLRQLQGEFPTLTITTDFYGHYRAWVASGINGHPWLVMSTDASRFRAALQQPSAPEQER